MRAAGLCTILVLSGCHIESWKYKTYPDNPFPDVQVVAILPFINQTPETRLKTEEFSNIFASEILKFDGFRVVRPRVVAMTLGEGEEIRTLEDAIRVGRRLKVDAVFVAAITDYDPYRPPKIGISVQFLRVASREISDSEIDRIVQCASWRRGPLAMGRKEAGHWMGAFERVYDAHQESVRRELTAYCDAQEGDDSAFRGDEEFIAVQARFMQFVSNQVINDVLTFAE